MKGAAISFWSTAAFVVLASQTVLAAGGGGGHEINQAQIWDLIYRVINFAILVVVLFFILRKPLAKGLNSRIENIKEELADLEARREEAKKEYALVEQRVSDAAGERDAIMAEYREQGEKEKQKIIANAETLSQRIKAQAEFSIEQETAAAKWDLKREVAEMSAKVAEELLKENIQPEDQSRLVDEYLTKVEGKAVQ